MVGCKPKNILMLDIFSGGKTITFSSKGGSTGLQPLLQSFILSLRSSGRGKITPISGYEVCPSHHHSTKTHCIVVTHQSSSIGGIWSIILQEAGHVFPCQNPRELEDDPWAFWLLLPSPNSFISCDLLSPFLVPLFTPLLLPLKHPHFDTDPILIFSDSPLTPYKRWESLWPTPHSPSPPTQLIVVATRLLSW